MFSDEQRRQINSLEIISLPLFACKGTATKMQSVLPLFGARTPPSVHHLDFSGKSPNSNCLFFNPIPITTSIRPSLLSTETLSRNLVCRASAGKYVREDYLVVCALFLNIYIVFVVSIIS